MKKTIGFPLRILGAFALLGAAGLGHAAEQITHYTYSNGKIDQFFINEPTVTSGGKFYPEIVMRGGDTILVSAGGCVQTGGRGATWRRYVDPSGPNSDRLYHGIVGLAYLNQMRLLDFMNSYRGTWVAPPGGYTWQFFLGYEDDGYGDNGYYSHDNGIDNQCLNVGSAWVTVTLIHP
jgi:hypothetical protein